MISLHHCGSKEQLTNIITKPLSTGKHVMIWRQLEVRRLQSRGVLMLIEGMEHMVSEQWQLVEHGGVAPIHVQGWYECW